MRIWLVVLAGVVALAMAVGADTRAPFRFMTLDPGHFHAGLVQKEMYPDVSPTVDVYAPEGPDLDAHLKRMPRSTAARTLPPAGCSKSTRAPTRSTACCASIRATSS